MKLTITLLCMVAACLLSAGCGPAPSVPAQPPSASATPCPTAATAGTGTNVGGTGGPSLGTTPAPAQTPLTPAQLATLSALESHTNPSGPTLPAGQPNTPLTSDCPTPSAAAVSTPTPCLTPGTQTNVVATSISVQASPPVQTTPSAAQTPLTPAQMATLAALESRTNPSGPPLPTGQPNALSTCPTPAATK